MEGRCVGRAGGARDVPERARMCADRRHVPRLSVPRPRRTLGKWIGGTSTGLAEPSASANRIPFPPWPATFRRASSSAGSHPPRRPRRRALVEEVPLANHLTPDELAEATGIERTVVVRLCVEECVPIYNGRIDKTLFVRSLMASGHAVPEQAQGLLNAAGYAPAGSAGPRAAGGPWYPGARRATDPSRRRVRHPRPIPACRAVRRSGDRAGPRRRACRRGAPERGPGGAERVRAAHPATSALVWRLDGPSPTPILAFKPDVSRMPASTMKLVTSAAALLTLGPDFRFETRLYAGVNAVRDGRVLRGRCTSRATATRSSPRRPTRATSSPATAATWAGWPAGCGATASASCAGRWWPTRPSSTPSAPARNGSPPTPRSARRSRASW